MKLRHIRKTKPRPREYTVSGSVIVPEYIGPFGFPMDTVRIHVRGSSQGDPDHRVCMAKLRAGKDAYLASKGQQ